MNKHKIENSNVFSTVVGNGYCVGCGACSAFDPEIQMKMDDMGRYVATKKHDQSVISSIAERVCPFADGRPNENEIASEFFSESPSHDAHIGYYLSNYAGWVTESDFRERGSSGGIASWLLVELLNRDMVDYVVHVAPRRRMSEGDSLFNFSISGSAEEVLTNAKSRYYPVHMANVIKQILDKPGRYVVVGIPCFVKAIRLACRESDILNERIKFVVGIVCGHLKSKSFSELFAWQCGILPDDLQAIDFRTKLPGRSASSYGVTVTGEREGTTVEIVKPTSELLGSNWGHGFFKYKACDFCDDVVGETADISIGDAWLPEFEPDSRGTNVVVVRSEELDKLLATATSFGRIHLEKITAAKVIESQAGGFRHRREGLSFRLYLADSVGQWRPKKRVDASFNHLTSSQRDVFKIRYELGILSHEAFYVAKAKFDIKIFVEMMRPLMLRHDKYYQRPLIIRALGLVKRKLFSFIKIS